MKIGVVTIFDCVNNSGAFLQAYALKCHLEKQGHDVYHIVKEKKDRFVNVNIRRYVAEYRPSGNPVVVSAKRMIRITKKTLDYRYRNWICGSDFRKMKAVTVAEANKLDLDLVVCGSDEIWNLNNVDVGDPFYFAKDINAKKKISYAASCGDCTAADLCKAKYPVQELIGFDKILVRDTHTFSAIQEVTDHVPKIVCDPTLLVDVDLLCEKAHPMAQKYMVVYSYGVCSNIRDHIIRYAKENDLQIVAPVIHQPFADRNVFVSPGKFIDILRNAECVYTSTLHGSIFTTLTHRSAVFTASLPKVKNILKELKQENRIVADDVSYEDFVRSIKLPVNSQEIDLSRDQMREAGIRELNIALGGL